jgi:hypothetical protein
MDNKIDFNIPVEVITEVAGHLNAAAAALQPYLLALSPEERRTLPKMSDKTVPFVEKTLDYAQTMPQFSPPYLNVEELAHDLEVHSQLVPLLRTAKIIDSGLDDTVMQAGAESYVNALAYYNSVKQAAKMDVIGAKVIYDDLKKRFERRNAKPDAETGGD